MNEPIPNQQGELVVPALQDLRILFLPKNSRTAYFQGLLATGRRRLNWDISIVCPDGTQPVWDDVVKKRDSFFLLPDFTERRRWEDDEKSVAEIDAFIAACERKSGVSAARIVLTGERDLGRGFSRQFYYWFPNRISRRVLADNTEPFRILRRIFAFARSTLETNRPDLLLTGEWADPLCFTYYLVAQLLGIRCIVNRPSKLWSGRCYWSDDLYWYNLSARKRVEEKRAKQDAVSARARARIESFRATPKTLEYVQRNWNSDEERRRWFAAHKELVRTLAVELRHHLTRRKSPPPKPALYLALNHYRRPLLRWRQARFFRRYSSDQLRDMRYIYLAMHKDPEQALNGQAPFWVNQYNTVTLVSGALPAGYLLLVREHRRNAGRRPTRYYKDLCRLPGVELIDSYDDQFKYICNADVIVTDNGTTGWEGLLLGRRVITLADNYYQAAKLGLRLRDPEQIASAILELLQKPAVADRDAHDQALGWMIDAEWETTSPLEDYLATLNSLGTLLRESVQTPVTRISA